MTIHRYRKFVVALVGAALIGLDQVFGISLAWGAEDIVTVVISAGTAFGVFGVPNARAMRTVGGVVLAGGLLAACSSVGDALITAAEKVQAGKDLAVERSADSIRTYCRVTGVDGRVRYRDALAAQGVHIALWTDDGTCQKLEGETAR